MSLSILLKVVEYPYDAWGKPLTNTGTLATTLGTLNPFRYRGYVYDEETGMYYLRSRDYNPVWGRFLNADSQLGKPGQLFGHNLFAYCRNNPMRFSAPNEHKEVEGIPYYTGGIDQALEKAVMEFMSHCVGDGSRFLYSV